MEPTRYIYLDGLRGLAALQVLISHCVAAFFPSYTKSLGFVGDGDFAVLLFFIISGFVLTFSFERTPYAVVENTLARVIRLGLPTAVATAIAFAAMSILPQWYAEVADLAGSTWLASKHLGGLLRAAADFTSLSLVTGCSDTTLFGFLAPYLPSIASSADGPIWSLHIELWGSLLVQLLVFSRVQSVGRHYAVVTASIVLIGGNALILFLVGHAAALFMRLPVFELLCRYRRTILFLGLLTLCGGIYEAEHNEYHYALGRLAMATSVMRPYGWFQWNKEIAAVLVFSAVLVLAPLQTALRAKPLIWLGKESFAIYLLHVPILTTLGALAYIAATRFGGTVAGSLAVITVCGASLLLAPLWERFIDRPLIRLSRAVRHKPLIGHAVATP